MQKAKSKKQKVKRIGEGDPRGWRRMKKRVCWLTVDKP
jgi:hypothetical protein